MNNKIIEKCVRESIKNFVNESLVEMPTAKTPTKKKKVVPLNKNQELIKKCLYIFSENNSRYWTMSAVNRFTELEGICFDLVFRQRKEPSEVASLLRTVAKNLNTVITDENDVKYYGRNMRRLAMYIQEEGVSWNPQYYKCN